MLIKNHPTSNPPRFPSWIIALAFAALACTTLTRGPFIPQTPAAPLTANGLIAYLGTDGNVYTIAENGENRVPVTENAQAFPHLQAYQNPTWSPDGHHLAFVSLESISGEQTARILVFTPETGETTEIYTDSTASPFYLYWSPDNASVSFLTSTPGSADLSLRLAFLNGDESRVADTGQPYYWAWAPDGSRFFVHEGGAITENPEARLSLFSPEGDQTQTFELTPGNFQAPAWSPDGTQLLAALGGAEQNELAILDLNGGKTQTFAEFSTSVSFSWSPDGEHIAYLTTTPASGGFLGPLHIVASDHADSLVTTEEDILAYFWAPDSQKIVYFTPAITNDAEASLISTQRQDAFQLTMYLIDVQTGTTRRLSTFTPTQDFLTVLPFFDQYHRSATLWSPDSTKVVYPSMNGADEALLWVVSVEGGQPVQLAEGTLAFWAWK